MITYKDGNLLDSFDAGEVQYIGHVVNCQGKMGKGIALAVKQKYPIAYEVYKDHCDKIYPKFRLLGSLQAVTVGEGTLFNLFAQEKYGTDRRHLHYGALAKSLFLMAKHIRIAEDEGWPHCRIDVGFPFGLGCGNAGGQWEVVEDLIGTAFKEMSVTIYKLQG